MRESHLHGSVREGPGNWPSYRDSLRPQEKVAFIVEILLDIKHHSGKIEYAHCNDNSPQLAAGYPRGGLALKIRDFQTSEYLLRRSTLRGIRPPEIHNLSAYVAAES